MELTKAQITAHGGPENIAFVTEDIPSPGAGAVLIEHTAVGLNFIDTYHRTGLYPVNYPAALALRRRDGLPLWVTGCQITP